MLSGDIDSDLMVRMKLLQTVLTIRRGLPVRKQTVLEAGYAIHLRRGYPGACGDG